MLYKTTKTGSGLYMVKDTTFFIYKISNNWKVGYKKFICIKEKVVMLGSIIQLNEVFETKKDALEFISFNGSLLENISSETHNWDCSLKNWITKRD